MNLGPMIKDKRCELIRLKEDLAFYLNLHKKFIDNLKRESFYTQPKFTSANAEILAQKFKAYKQRTHSANIPIEGIKQLLIKLDSEFNPHLLYMKLPASSQKEIQECIDSAHSAIQAMEQLKTDFLTKRQQLLSQEDSYANSKLCSIHSKVVQVSLDYEDAFEPEDLLSFEGCSPLLFKQKTKKSSKTKNSSPEAPSASHNPMAYLGETSLPKQKRKNKH